MKKSYLLLLVLCCFFFGNTYAQKGKNTPKQGHEIIFNIKDAKDKIVYLVIHYNEKLILKDSVAPTSPGKYIFKGSKVYDDGLYSLVSEGKKMYLNFIIDNNQFFTYNLELAAKRGDAEVPAQNRPSPEKGHRMVEEDEGV